MSNKLDIMKLAAAGINAHLEAGNDSEAGKAGTLRGGNTGMVNEKGEIIGSCAASTYLRMKGIKHSKPVDMNKELMFAGGRLNEDHWLSALKTSYDGPILCEEEIPTKWKTSQGINVTGRPDIVLCNNVDNKIVPEHGIELKQCMSINSAYNCYVKREPQLKHLMQAAHYMWQLDCDFTLAYTNRNNLDMPSWMEFRPFPKPGEPGTESIGYRYYRWGDINPKTNKPKKHQLTETEYLSGTFRKTFAQAAKITPFIQGFKLSLQSGRLYYQDASDSAAPWMETIVKIADIQRFYEYVGDLEQYGKVPREALNLTPSGAKLGWKFSAYSDMQELDPGHCAGQNLQKWVEKVAKKFSDK
jgi:hypothetical protein